MPNILTEADLKWALTHLDKYGDTDLFPRPFEIMLMTEHKRRVIDHVRNLDIAQYRWQEPRRTLVLKDELSFRNACQLEPLDAVLFAGLIRHHTKALEAHRGDKDGKRIFSYRTKPEASGRLYSDDRYKAFWQASATLSGSAEIVLVTDISDFYNRVYHHTVEQELNAAKIPTPGLSRESPLHLKHRWFRAARAKFTEQHCQVQHFAASADRN